MEQYQTVLLGSGELSKILQNSYLHDLSSFFIVEKDGTYVVDERFTYGDPVYKALQIQHRFELGHTVLIKNLEHWNLAIAQECQRLGGDTNVHLYASPIGGSAFDWHADDRDVYIYMQHGQKKFQLRKPSGEIETFVVSPGQRLFIPYGVQHRAFAQEVSSVHLSFGKWPEAMTISETYPPLAMTASLKDTF
ncbi:MAG: hypothetical protein ACLGG7_12855 [Bacteriovoracia bacterium]